MIRHGMIKRLRTWLYRKRETPPKELAGLEEELAGVEADKQRHERGMNQRAEQAFFPRRDSSKR
jgi:hypothetical protein